MDRRFLFLGLLLLAASGAVHGAGWSRSLWAWGIPFALMLLFLGIVGRDPDEHLAHLKPEPPMQEMRGGHGGH